MKKIALLALLLYGCLQMAAAQSVLTSANYNNAAQPALMLNLPYNADVSEDAIVDNLKKTGYNLDTKGSLFWKKKQQDGFMIFKNVMLQGASTPVDLYFKVEGKKKGDQSVIYMLINNAGNFIASDSRLFEPSKNFLNDFVAKSASYKLDLDIKVQDESVKNAERKLQKLIENEKDLNKKMTSLQEDLKKNKAEQEKQLQAINAEKQKLENLKASTN